MQQLISYFERLKLGKVILWCYLIWYLVTVYFHFDLSSKIWLNSLGISALIGTGLVLSVSVDRVNAEGRWQIFRLYLMPFCVSSFSTLTKGQEFYVFVSPQIHETLISILGCAIFCGFVFGLKANNNKVFRSRKID